MSTIETNKWYVVYSKPQKEDFAEICLRRRGVEVFLPRLLFPEALGKRRRLVPLFPNYLFTWISDPEQYHCVIWTPGVKRIVSFNGVPAPLDDNVVTFLKQQASEAGIIGARSNLRVGQEVQITGGPFDGLVGIIEDPPDARGRVKVLMHLLSREIRVEVPLRFVNDCWVPCLSQSVSAKIGSEAPAIVA
jgi:transcriptional antiterminator RfaH